MAPRSFREIDSALRAWVGDAHPIDQRRAAKAKRRSARTTTAEQWRAIVLHTRAIGGDARASGKASGERRRMPGRRLGDRVVLIGVLEHGACVIEPRQTAGELLVESREVVRPHLVDREEHDQGRPGRRLAGPQAMLAVQPRRRSADQRRDAAMPAKFGDVNACAHESRLARHEKHQSRGSRYWSVLRT